ncbi:MAG: lipoxygenase family protein, partial [Myxococcota bacterium]
FDLRRFAALQPQTADGAVRFTPATVTLLRRDPRSGDLRPIAVLVSGHDGAGRQVYTRPGATDDAWLYALLAAKTSITVFGIWLGHVYQWHLVTAAMQMTLLNTLTPDHPIHQLLGPQSKYLIAFDEAILTQWSAIAPPTSLTTADQFLGLCNGFADGRSFFDDDPRATLARMGLRERDFSAEEPWDRFPVARKMLAVWTLVERYVRVCVEAMYGTDAAVASDAALQAWIASSSAPEGGNIQGLPAMTSRDALVRVCTSILNRITIHGASRLNSTPNPALAFVANFPHCLQRDDIPSPRAHVDTRELLTYLPNTKTIAQALSFYYVFAFSTPYEPYIPLGGPDADLFFPGGPTSRRNRALIQLREGVAGLIAEWQPGAPQLFQWPRNVET